MFHMRDSIFNGFHADGMRRKYRRLWPPRNKAFCADRRLIIDL